MAPIKQLCEECAERPAAARSKRDRVRKLCHRCYSREYGQLKAQEQKAKAAQASSSSPKPPTHNNRQPTVATTSSVRPPPTPVTPETYMSTSIISPLAREMQEVNLDPCIVEQVVKCNNLYMWATDYQQRLLDDVNFLRQEVATACAYLASKLTNADAWFDNAQGMLALILLELWMRRNSARALDARFEKTRDLLRRSYETVRMELRSLVQ